MPSEGKIRELFVPQRQLSDEEWLMALDIRRAMIEPHLDEFTLGSLGKVKCITLGGMPNQPLVAPGLHHHPYDIQGIFVVSSSSRQYPQDANDTVNPGSFYIWGLTRSGDWALVRVTYRNDFGYKGRTTQHVEDVDFAHSMSTGEMCKTANVKPRDVFVRLGKEVQAWAERRKQLYELAQRLADDMAKTEWLVGLAKSH